MSLPDKRERALWLADKLVGDYGSEAAQLLRWFAAPSTADAPAALKIAARLEKRINTDTTIEPLSNHEQLDHDAAQMIRKLAAPSAIAPPFKLPLRAEHIPYEGTWFYDPDGNDVEHEVIADFINKNFGPTDGSTA